ncbi:MAG TPA: polyprenyl synthetase family protein [Roseiflexaceae bacterium]|nr:polyprenyl synthetase family protein [Roseiflexaceae bacterium]
MALSPVRHDLRINTTRVLARPAAISPGEVFRRAGLIDDLAVVERRLLDRTASHSQLLSDSGAYTVAAGGKRLRAAMVLLAARLGSYQLDRAVHPAAAVELLHAASLVHDDLVDHAGMRRGRVTVHERWDQHVALMLGDYFFALAADELSAEPDPRIIRFYAEAAHVIVEGELSPVRQLEPLDVALQQYRYKTGCKTAALFEAACKAGIAVGGGTPEQIEALGRFGYDMGVAFQIVDDVLDFTGDEAALGKPAGNDLREGTLTLPLIYAVADSRNPLLRDLVRNPRPDPALVPQIVAAVIAEGGTDRAMDEANRTVERALFQLERFSHSPARRALSEICEFVLARQS